MVLLTTALPRPPLDGSIHLRSDKPGVLIRRTDYPLSADGERIRQAQGDYSRCMGTWAARHSRSVRKNEGMLSAAQEMKSFKAAEKECYEAATAKWKVKVVRFSKQEIDQIIATMRRMAENFPGESPRARGQFVDPNDDNRSPRDTRGEGFGRGPNANRMTLTQPQDGLNIRRLFGHAASYLRNDGPRRRPGIGSPVPRPMLFAPM